MPHPLERVQRLCALVRGPSGGAAPSDRPEGAEWPVLLALARDQRLLALAVRAARRAGLALPDSCAPSITPALRAQSAHTLTLIGALKRVARAFDAAHIPHVVLKGPPLAQLLYGDPALRESLDLDVMVAPHRFADARAVLLDLGYRPQFELSPRHERAYVRQFHDYGFEDDGGTLIELHWALAQRRYGFGPDATELLRSACEVSGSGWSAPVPSPEHTLLHLATHAAKHGWNQLDLMVDFATAASILPVDWPRVRALARRLGVRRILDINLALADRLGWPVPMGGMAASAGVDAGRLLARAAHGAAPTAVRAFIEDIAMRERWRDRARLLAHTLQPTPQDWNAVSLPDALYGLYYVVRPLRLLLSRTRG